MDLFFFETLSNSTYILMDGMLRRITENTFYNLFDKLMNPSGYIHFNLEESPYPIGWPLPDNAKLVKEKSIVFLEDVYPWDTYKIILRPVIRPVKEVNINWDFVKFVPANPVYGVPLSINNNHNIKTAQELAGLQELYKHFVDKEHLNPFFYYLLPNYPGEDKSEYESILKLQIEEVERKMVQLMLNDAGAYMSEITH
ncbi:hypothetical protein [Flavobacterium rhizosphaerae]|uniref:Bacteriocin-protection, YdeI or OmpD-Associated n=1 Tax=Flavobacterium rhizosphaerae TaxID=3163298 RepID=A0ABW8YRU0_9FLAO